MRFAAFFLTASITLFATGCGGGGGSAAIPVGQAPVPPIGGQAIHATAKLVIPNASLTSSARSPRFVSNATNGVNVITYAHTDANHTTALATVVTDVSSSSSACTGTGATRTCTVGVQGPPGSDDFVFTTYDTAPVSGTIPTSAHLLGTAGITQTLSATIANVVTATIGGVITGLSGQTNVPISVPGDGSVHNIGMTISAADFGSNTITGTNGIYANPVTVAVTEHGGTGHATVQLNGGIGAASVQASKSADAVQVVYDGKGSPGYYITVALTAAAVNSQGGATEAATISPLLVSSTNSDYTQASSSVGMKGNGDFAPFTVGEGGAVSPVFTFTRGTHCPAVALLETVSATTFNILALGNTSTYAASTGCAIAVSDGTSTVTLGVSNAYTHAFGSVTVTDYTLTGTTASVAVGPDGNMWFGDSGHGKIGKFPTSNPAGYTAYAMPAGANTSDSYALNPGPDGNMWFADCTHPALNGKMTTSGTGTIYPSTIGSATTIATGPDGNLWFSSETGPTSIGRVTPSGTVTAFSMTSGSGTCGVAEGPDGNLWFTECTGSIAKVSPTGAVLAEYPTNTTNRTWGIVAGPDGALWFTEPDDNIIGRITTSGTVTHFPGGAAGNPFNITVGSDGALWFNEGGKIGRITTAGSAVTEYANNSNTWQITAGPDGSIWFADCSAQGVGQISF